MTTNPHANTPTLSRGPSPKDAALTLLLIHGRGASAQSILSLLPALTLPQDKVAALAPQAANHTWYPHSFLAPFDANQPWLDSALERIGALVDSLLNQNIPASRIALLGFSQGACLASEFLARNPRRYAALIAFSGGLIGPPGAPRRYPGSLQKTPVFLGCSDIDPHIPWSRVEETADVFRTMHAAVNLRSYPRMPHTINDDELAAAHTLLTAALNPSPSPNPSPENS
jgi:predicted esterase